MRRHEGFAGVVLAVLAVGAVPATHAQQPSQRSRDAVVEAQTPRNVPETRPEQRKTAHDQSDVFGYGNAEDTVEFFNIVLGLKLTKDEKPDLVAFLRTL